MYSVHEKTYYIFIYVLCTWTNLLYLYLCTRLPVFYHGSLWFRILPRLGGLYMPKAVITRHYKLLLSPTLNGKTHIMFVNGVVCNLLYTILSLPGKQIYLVQGSGALVMARTLKCCNNLAYGFTLIIYFYCL